MENIGGTNFLTGFHDVAKALNLILIHKGTIASIPSGYHLCDGNAGTIDLRNVFIVGANADVGGVAKTTITGVAEQTGGGISHQHSLSGISTDTGYANLVDSGHQHTTTYDDIDSFLPPFTAVAPAFRAPNQETTGTGYAAANDLGHTHTTTGNTDGSGVAPPFYALAFMQAI